MLDECMLERANDSPIPLSAQQVEGTHRLSNLKKLHYVPAFALRQLLESRVPGQALGHLQHAELVAEADRLSAITSADVVDLYENYRYGQRLSFYLYLLPGGLAAPTTKVIQAALDELAVPDPSDLASQVSAGHDFETETSPNRVVLLAGATVVVGVVSLLLLRRRGPTTDDTEQTTDKSGLATDHVPNSFGLSPS